MDEKFKKHYLQVVKTVTEQGENISRLNGIVTELQVAVVQLQNEVKTLKEQVSGHATLLVDIHGKDAVDLHTSFPVKDEKEKA